MFEYVENGILERPEEDELWDILYFKKNFKVSIPKQCENDSNTLEFDLINIDCSFANAIRRMLIAEVPSVAIDSIYLYQNTSIIADEILCHRIALIPLEIDPSTLLFPKRPLPPDDSISNFDPQSHILFDFSEKCTKETLKNILCNTLETNRSQPIYSSALKWIPLPGQEERYSDLTVKPTSDKILINKLTANTEIQAKCLAVKGIGRDHAKFQPVSACYYKFCPNITLNQKFEGQQAKLLKSCFAEGVIEIETSTGIAKVSNARLDNGSREHLRYPEFNSKAVSLYVDPKHCIFVVESISRSPKTLVLEAFDIMIDKCKHYLAISGKEDFNAPIPETEELLLTMVCGRSVGLEILKISADNLQATFRFTGEDHTLGAALRFCILRNSEARFCGYCVPHPLEDTIHLEVHSKKENVIYLMRNGLQTLEATFQHIKTCFAAAIY